MAQPRGRDLAKVAKAYREAIGDNRSEFRRNLVAIMGSTAQGAIEGAGFARGGPGVIPAAVVGAALYGGGRAATIALRSRDEDTAGVQAIMEAMNTEENRRIPIAQVGTNVAARVVNAPIVFGLGRLAGVVDPGTVLSRSMRSTAAAGLGEAVRIAIEEGDRALAASPYDPVRYLPFMGDTQRAGGGTTQLAPQRALDAVRQLDPRRAIDAARRLDPRRALDSVRQLDPRNALDAVRETIPSADERAEGADTNVDPQRALELVRGGSRASNPSIVYLNDLVGDALGRAGSAVSSVARSVGTTVRDAVNTRVGDTLRQNLLEPARNFQTRVEREAARRIVDAVVPRRSWNPYDLSLRGLNAVDPRLAAGGLAYLAWTNPDAMLGGPQMSGMIGRRLTEVGEDIASGMRAGVRTFRDAQMQARQAVSNALGRVNLEAERAVTGARSLIGGLFSGGERRAETAPTSRQGAAPSNERAAASRREDVRQDGGMFDPMQRLMETGTMMPLGGPRPDTLNAMMEAEEREIQAAERARGAPLPRNVAPMMLGGPVDNRTVAVNDLKNEQAAALVDRTKARTRGNRNRMREASDRFRETVLQARDRLANADDDLKPLLRQWTRRDPRSNKVVTVHRKKFWR